MKLKNSYSKYYRVALDKAIYQISGTLIDLVSA